MWELTNDEIVASITSFKVKKKYKINKQTPASTSSDFCIDIYYLSLDRKKKTYLP